MRKKLFALALTLVLFISVPLNTTLTVSAAGECLHTHGVYFGGVTEVAHWETWHMVPNKYVVDDYVQCFILCQRLRYWQCCIDCNQGIAFTEQTVEHHSEEHE